MRVRAPEAAIESIARGLSEQYVQNALAGGTIVAVLAAFVGYFVIARRAAFATHALSQIGFAGAAGAILIGLEPLAGLLGFAVLGALGLGVLGARVRNTDVITALVLVCSLGTGALFLALQRDYASNAFSLLFGSILGVDRAELAITAVAALCAVVALGAIARPLLFASVAPEAAAAAGLRVGALDVAFLVIVALASAVTVPIVGTLLVYSLVLGPSAAAGRLTREPLAAILLALGLGVGAVVAGILLAYATGWPVGFFVSAIVVAEYVVARSLRLVR